MALAIVGTPVVTSVAGAAPTITYTVPANSLVVLVFNGYGFTGTGQTHVGSITDTGSLTWQRRNKRQFTSAYAGSGTTAGSIFQNQEVWWAFATAAQTAATITVHIPDSANQGTAPDILVFGVSGVQNASAPWDTGTFAETHYSDASTLSGGAPSQTYTTGQANSMVLSFLQEFNSSSSATANTVGTGATSIASNSRGTGSNNLVIGAEFALQASPGAGTIGWAGAGKLEYGLLTDALSGTATGSSADLSASVLDLTGTVGHTHDTSGTVTTISASITTQVADTIVIAVIGNFNQAISGTLKTVSGVSGGGLTWAKRSSQSMDFLSGSSQIDVGLEVWWAHATGTLAAQSITATFSAAPNQRTDILVFAVEGSQHLTAPWDTNVALPAKASNNSLSSLTTPTVTANVTATSSMLLAFMDYAWNANAANTVGSGYTDILAPTTDNSLRDHWEFQNAASSGSKTFNFTNTQEGWALIGDALRGDSAVTNATGTITTSLTKASLSLAGAEKFTGTVTTALIKASQALAAQEKFVVNTMTTNLTRPSQSLSGSVHIVLTGSIATHLIKPSQSAVALTGDFSATGTITTALPAHAVQLHAVTFELFVGTIRTNLSPANFSLVGVETITGHVVTRLGSETGQMIGNIVEAEEIIEGPITMALSPFRPLILAAQLGTPGAGKWYSWRHTDS